MWTPFSHLNIFVYIYISYIHKKGSWYQWSWKEIWASCLFGSWCFLRGTLASFLQAPKLLASLSCSLLCLQHLESGFYNPETDSCTVQFCNALCLTESHCHVVSTGSKNKHGAYSMCSTCYCIWFLNYYQLQAQTSWLELARYHLERAWSTLQGSSACCWATSHMQFLAVTEPLPFFFMTPEMKFTIFCTRKRKQQKNWQHEMDRLFLSSISMYISS